MEDLVNGRCGWCGTNPLYVAYHDQEWGKPITDDRKLFEFLVLESAQAGLSWITILRKREGYRTAFCQFDAQQVAALTPDDVERLMQFEGIVRNRLKIKSTISNAQLFLAIQQEYGSFYRYLCSYFTAERCNAIEQTTTTEEPTTTKHAATAGATTPLTPLTATTTTATRDRVTRDRVTGEAATTKHAAIAGFPIVNRPQHLSELPTHSAQSDALSKDLKKRGFKFLGSTICYAFLQATGFVDDHLAGCICR
ncbi:MAG: DNA-3-methyladenine glycosylase I [Phocaeicola sp.]